MFKRRVIIVDDCPFCSSPKTGYIIASTKTDPRICRRYLRYGEYVRLQQYANDDRNCFCLDCNAEWHQKLYSKKLSFIELCELKERKGIEQALLEPEPIVIKPNKKKRKKKDNKIIKAFVKTMIYDPTIGTAKDILHIGQTEQTKVQDKEPQDFKELYREVFGAEPVMKQLEVDSDFEEFDD
ncbi:hypothetical protein bpr_II249 (plasmid) [Butyrivibrio proteoclasticus B316]|uniref:Uncharacterized protein n=1 Tax=Butyrivibrio proteoclasticus (strain ATCC 51982 / DSM 14932 / B316) TaxID=515622 RepID=E0S454_BUTPB|nr:hypothetical protein [Butyrivibrio proteoclasticus]ADL36186.1 hypothetical protein bpr_II249 [Butyrivibrio proteoclasticus B316]